MPPTLLLTRPQDQSEATAARFQAMGWRTIIWPMTVIERLTDTAPDVSGAQAVLLTSPRGAESFCLASRDSPTHHATPAFTVGPATTAAASATGFKTVVEAGGDGAALIALAKERLDPQGGPIIHVCGADQAVDLAGRLCSDGFDATAIVTYRARIADQPQDKKPADIATTHLDCAAFYSPRAAGLFAQKMQAEPLHLTATTAIAISEKAAAPLASLGFARVMIADAPNGTAMHAAICGTAPLKR